MSEEWLIGSEIDDYLNLIGVIRTKPDLELLRQIVARTLEVIPFQNLTMLDNEREVPTIEDIKRLMLSGVGGICTIRNPFIHQLLRKLGFDARLVASTIMQPDCHITILVSIDDDLWWCDPGNGFPYFSIIRLGDETIHSHPFLSYRLVKSGNTWELQHKKKDGIWFTNHHFNTEFVEFNHFTEMYEKHYTVPEYGPFLTGLRVNLWTELHGAILRDHKATNSTHTKVLNNVDGFIDWVDNNISPLKLEHLLGTRKKISKLWSVIQ
jgi:arylamine N-acetyltransferase